MSPRKRDAKQQAKTRQRRHLKAQERLERDRRQAQQAAEVLEQALHDLGIPDNLVAEIEGRLRSQQKLLGKIVLSGIDGVLLVVVIGEGKLVVPVDFAMRWPDPTGPGEPCRDKLHWLQGMLDGRVAAFRRRGVALPTPMVVVDSWFSDSKLMRHVATTHQGTFLVEGKSTYTFALPDGRQVKGSDLQQPSDWLWRESPQVPGVRYARLRATSPTYGAVTLVVISAPREEQFYVMCLATAISGPRLIQAWKRRHWIEYCFRTLKHLLATGACQVQSEDAYYGHLV